MAVRKLTDEGVNLYPLDVSALVKGDYIPPEFCEDYTKCHDRNSKDYPLQLQSLKERIDHELLKVGRNWTLVCHKNGIGVLTDERAAGYNEQQFDANMRAARRRARKNVSVDSSVLTEEGRRRHEHVVITQTLILAAAKRARREASLPAHKRTVPSLPAASKPKGATP